MAVIEPAGADSFFLSKPYMKNGRCADFSHVHETKNSLFFSLVDVAGHGDGAYHLVPVIKKYLEKNHKKDLLDLMHGLHELLRGTRGAVGLAGLLDKKTGAVQYVGIGNISMRVFGKKDTRILSNEGIIGYVIRTLKVERLRLMAGGTLLLYTDGIRDYFDRTDCPKGLFQEDAKHVVKGIMKHFFRGDDDAGCFAIRRKND